MRASTASVLVAQLVQMRIAMWVSSIFFHGERRNWEAMVFSSVLRVTGQQLELFFNQNMETMKLRAMIGEHILSQFSSRYLDLHCTTPRERYEMLLQRCPDIMELLDLQDFASFLNIHPNTVSRIRRDITFGDK